MRSRMHRLNSLKVWSVITGVALTVALVLTFLPIQATIDTDGMLSIDLSYGRAQESGKWVINGTTVYWDDEDVYLSATPHTLKGSGWVEFELMTKQWSGDIDVVWGLESGFNITASKPQRWALNVSHEMERWAVVERQYEQTFDSILSYDNIGWGSNETPDLGNYNNTYLVKLGLGVSGNSTFFNVAFNSYVQHSETSATFYGNYDSNELETYYEYYDDWIHWSAPPIQTVNYTYAGVDKWHIVQLDTPVQADKTYKVRCWLDVPFTGLNHFTTKYVWGGKPQNETVAEARASGHLYILDPWIEGGWDYRKEITVTNANADYQTKVLIGESSGATGEDVDCGGYIADDFDDLRFTAADGTTLLDYWIESITGTTPNGLATVWVQNNDTPDTTLYMYYGGTETAVSSGADTFIQYHGAAVATFKDADASGASTSVYYRAKVTQTAVAGGNALWGIANQIDGSDDNLLIQSSQGTDLRYHGAYNEGASTKVSEAPDIADAAWHIIEMKFLTGASLDSYMDSDAIATQITTNLPDESMGLWMWEVAGACEQEWSFISKYLATEPSFAFGSEETPTPEITNTPDTWAIGIVQPNNVKYFSADNNQDDDYALITNTGNCAVDIQIQGTDIEGGSYDWVLTSSAGSEAYSLYANSEATPTVYDIEVKSSLYNNLCTDLAEDATYNWSMKFTTPTVFNANDDGGQKSCTVTLVASAA